MAQLQGRAALGRPALHSITVEQNQGCTSVITLGSPKLSFTQAITSQRLHTQMVIFDQIAHRIVDMAPDIQIVSSYNTENAPFTVLVLVVITTVEASLPP